MTSNKAQKKVIRARMGKTGERYTAARRHLVAADDAADDAADSTATGPAANGTIVEPATDDATNSTRLPIIEQPGLSDVAIRQGTGKSWNEWLEVLDAWGARDRTHKEIAAYVGEHFGVGGWYAQSVTVGYERMRGLRAYGQGRDGTFTGSVSKTFPVPVATLYRAWVDDAERDRWLDPGTLRLRTAQLTTSARFDVAGDGSILAVWFVDKGAQKSSVQLQNEKLPTKAAADQFRVVWKERLVRLGEVLKES